MSPRSDDPVASSGDRGLPESDALTPRGSDPEKAPPDAETRVEPSGVAPGRPEGLTPGVGVDLDRAQARAKLKASLFQIESEPVKIGRFSILSRLGQGGMGVVYSAFDEDLDRRVAVKVMLPEASSPSARDRMRREAQAMARLSHHNIVGVHEVGEVAGQVYIAMEFVRGCSLSEWLRDEERRWTEVLEVLIQAGRGLHAAHEAGLVHRDFKPQNVMIGDDGSVKVLDFGLARDEKSFFVDRRAVLDREALLDVAITQTGALVGTPAYMAPEQHEARPVTARSDQFSFCAALYKGLYGMLPFEGQTVESLMVSITSGEIRRIPSDSLVPTWVLKVVRRGLSVDPEQRYASMAELLQALADDPQAQRRRRIRLGALVVALLGGGYGLAQVDAATLDACPDAREALDGVWDDERRAALDTALTDGGSANAEQTWARLEPALEEYAQSWVAIREAACEQRRQGVSSDLLYERRVACLDRARVGLQTVVEVVEQGDVTVANKAIAAVSGLPPAERCEDADVVLADVEAPTAAVADAVIEARQQLSRARVLEDLGRFEAGLTLAQGVEQQAQTLDYRPLRAEALLRRGTIELAARSGDAADESLSAALWLALRTGQDAVAAEAAARRLFVRSELLGRPEHGQYDIPLAQSLIARVDDEPLRGLLLNNEAMLYFRQGQASRAVTRLHESLEIKRSTLGPRHPDVAHTTFNLALVQRKQGDLRGAVRSLETVEQIFDEALGPWHPDRASVLTMLASTLIDQGRFDAAAAALDQSEQIDERNHGADSIFRLELLLRRSKLATRRRRYADAREASDNALQIAASMMPHDHPKLLPFHLDLTDALAGQGQLAEAEAYLAARVAGLKPDEPEHQRLRVGAWSRLGRLQLRAGAAEAAAQTLQRALDGSQLLEPREPAGEAWLGSWLGRARLQAGDVEGAAPLIVRGFEALLHLEAKGSPRRLDTVEALAELRWAQGDAAAAAEEFAAMESVMASLRDPGDPALAWVRVRRARARYEGAPEARAAARATIAQAQAILAAEPGFGEEAAQAQGWLDEHPA